MASVGKVLSRVRFFDAVSLELLRWVSQRYVAPLASVIARAVPPRVVSEEGDAPRAGFPVTPHIRPAGSQLPASGGVGYRGRDALFGALSDPGGGEGTFLVRPVPEDEVGFAVDAVAACLDGGRRALVIVPEASPLPATASALVSAFGVQAGVFMGGNKRERYGTWLDILAGRYDVVVATRPGVFAPVPDLGMVYVSRESHPAHREDRVPYYHVRDVAVERARSLGAVCVLAALCHSSEAAALDAPIVEPAQRAWPPVEVVKPVPEGRAPRLVKALERTRRGFLYSPLPGAGVAQVCKVCAQSAACSSCGGVLRSAEGSVACIVCEAPGRCVNCGASDFGIRAGGAERVVTWAGRAATVPVHRISGPRARLPLEAEILVGGADAVRDLGPAGLDLVAILDVDLAERRAGIGAREQALATWMEAASWARPQGRVIAQSNRPADPAVQALVRGDPGRFHQDEAARRAAAGFPVGHAVFRVVGTAALERELADLEPSTLLVTSAGDSTVCLLALALARVPAFGKLARELAAKQTLTRVEADPHLW